MRVGYDGCAARGVEKTRANPEFVSGHDVPRAGRARWGKCLH
jgi:hypothetical protein